MSNTDTEKVQSNHPEEETSNNTPSKEELTEARGVSTERAGTGKENTGTESVGTEATEAESVEAESAEMESVEAGAAETEATEAESIETESAEKKPKRKRKYVKWLVAAVLLIFLLCAGTYSGIAFYYKTHFLPNTTINTIVCSNMGAVSATALLDAQIEEYTLEITGRDYTTGEPGTVLAVITASDIQLAYEDSQEVIDYLLAQQENMLWIRVLANQAYCHSVMQGVTFDDVMLEQVINSWDACQKKNMVQPENAYIGAYSEAVQGYEIVLETTGTQLDTEKVFESVKGALLMHQSTIDLEEAGCYIEATVTRDDSEMNRKVETANKWLRTEISYDWNGNSVKLDAEILKDWVSMEPDGPVLDEEAVAEYVKSQAREWDTYGKKRKFTTTLGIELTLPSGYYGWQTDRTAETEALLQLIYQGSVTEKEPVYSSEAMQKGINDIGNSYVEADLSNQHLYLYIDGEIVLETDFVSGKMSEADCITPPGVFGISYKTRNAVLRGRDYETPVKYWMPFYGNYGMHDATWRRTFGGDIYLTNGSHGCINLPLNVASKIYEYMEPGFPVICYYYTQEQLNSFAPEAPPQEQPVENGQPEEALPQEQPVENGQPEEAPSQEQPVESEQPVENGQPEENAQA